MSMSPLCFNQGTREQKPLADLDEAANWKGIMKGMFLKTFRGKQARQSTDQDTVGAERPIPRRNASIQCSESEMDLERHEDASESEEDEGTAAARRVLLERTNSFRFHTDENDVIPISVEHWLPVDFRARYAPLFIDNGYDDTSFISGITEDDVAAIGISSRTHISALMSAIRQLPEIELVPSIPDSVNKWLRDVGLQMYEDNFTRCHIVTTSHLDILRTMTKTDIKTDLGITKAGHIRRLKLALLSLRLPTIVEQELEGVKDEIKSLESRNLASTNPNEFQFWEDLRKARLIPDTAAFMHDLDLKGELWLCEKLTELRNFVITIYAVGNALWLTLIFTLIDKSALRILGTTVLDLVFVVVFGLTIIIQFISMLFHRLSTWMHITARAPYCCRNPYNATWSWRELTRPGRDSETTERGEEDNSAEIQTAYTNYGAIYNDREQLLD
ncbi:hypothetical protein LSH36_145g07014 [Paralvinella palmiformis]|uniref:SAM domain-containing protein n=1 Tax=Paralvinella palmiformis TaxID=53620 RepID=A0AAD9JW85_9ANNE|nr:hypothetical protein LSH36_145g07014 [Paralvinella palmiformis]